MSARPFESEKRFREIAEAIEEVFFLVDPEVTRMIYISPAYERIWGRDAAVLYLQPRAWLDAVLPEDRFRVMRSFDEMRQSHSISYEYRIRRPDDAVRWIHTRTFPIFDGHGRLDMVAGVAADITERKEAEIRVQRLNRVYAVLSGINNLIVHTRERQLLLESSCRIAVEQGGFGFAFIGMVDPADKSIRVVAAHGSQEDIDLVNSIEYSADEGHPGGGTTIGRAVRTRSIVYNNEFSPVEGADPRFTEFFRRNYRSVISLPLMADGESIGVFVMGMKEHGFFDEDELKLLAELANDVSFALEFIDNEQQVQYLAYHDTLTGLANRASLRRRLDSVIAESTPQRKPFVLMLINVNRFRDINDTIGHHNGDRLLKEIANRLHESVWESDLVASLGGDEFAVLIPQLARREDINLVVYKIERALYRPFQIASLPINIEASIGVALFPDHGDDADVLWQRADVALRAAKTHVEACCFYSPQIDHYEPQRLTLLGELRGAIDLDQLVLHWQPWVDTRSRRTVGAEALVRWNHPDRGLIYPDHFVPFAEQTGLISAFTTWVLANALRQGHTWHKAGMNLDIAVNISARNLLDPNLGIEIMELARSSRFPLHKLIVEVTESAIMSDPERARIVLEQLHASGIKISIDDFGTGQSSLAYIRNLPVHRIKVDKSFVIGFQEPRNAAIVRSVVELGHQLGLSVTAEGVESDSTLLALGALGCDTVQGYYLSRPAPADKFVSWLSGSSWPCTD